MKKTVEASRSKDSCMNFNVDIIKAMNVMKKEIGSLREKVKKTTAKYNQKIDNMESTLESMKELLEQMNGENRSKECEQIFHKIASKRIQLFSEVTKKKDIVSMYDKKWYVLSNENGVVTLISKESAGKINKAYADTNDELCRALDEYSEEYLKNIKGSRKVLYTEVCSCRLAHIEWEHDILRTTGYYYWLVSFGDPAGPRYVDAYGDIDLTSCNMTNVRPVVSLKPDVYTIGKDRNGVWILDE